MGQANFFICDQLILSGIPDLLSLINGSDREANYIEQDQKTHTVGATANLDTGAQATSVHSGGTEVRQKKRKDRLWDEVDRQIEYWTGILRLL